LECLLETTKIALRGRKKKFEFILSDGSKQIEEIDGDEFAECDYGLVIDNSQGTQALGQKLETLAQAGLQNQMINFSTMMKLYSTDSIAEKIRMIEAAEKRMQEQQEQQQQEQEQQQQNEDQMDKETAEQILQALEQDEQDTQEKMQRQQGKKRRVEKEW
jgi:hypothetical protein